MVSARTVLLLRRPDQGQAFSAALTASGRVVRFQSLHGIAWTGSAELDAALQELPSFAWVAFTSANGVQAAHACWRALGSPGRWPRIACVGEGTAHSARSLGLEVALIPAQQDAEGLLAALLAEGVAGRRILLPRAANARPLLAEGLSGSGAEVVAATAYVSTEPEPTAIDLSDVAALVFFSSEGVRRFSRQLGLPARWPPTVAIGPQTAASLQALGQGPAAIAVTPHPLGLVAAVDQILPIG